MNILLNSTSAFVFWDWFNLNNFFLSKPLSIYPPYTSYILLFINFITFSITKCLHSLFKLSQLYLVCFSLILLLSKTSFLFLLSNNKLILFSKYFSFVLLKVIFWFKSSIICSDKIWNSLFSWWLLNWWNLSNNSSIFD